MDVGLDGHDGQLVGRLRQLLAASEERTAAIRLTLELFDPPPRPAPVPEPEPVPRRRKSQPAVVERKLRRAETAAFLATLEADGPMTVSEMRERGIPTRGIAVLVRHGYVKKKGDAYARTSAEYRP